MPTNTIRMLSLRLLDRRHCFPRVGVYLLHGHGRAGDTGVVHQQVHPAEGLHGAGPARDVLQLQLRNTGHDYRRSSLTESFRSPFPPGWPRRLLRFIDPCEAPETTDAHIRRVTQTELANMAGVAGNG